MQRLDSVRKRKTFLHFYGIYDLPQQRYATGHRGHESMAATVSIKHIFEFTVCLCLNTFQDLYSRDSCGFHILRRFIVSLFTKRQFQLLQTKIEPKQT